MTVRPHLAIFLPTNGLPVYITKDKMPSGKNSPKDPKDKEKKTARVPYHHKPDEMPVDVWQKALRRQFAETQNFTMKNIGSHPVFSDFEVHNPQSGNTYKVAVRSEETGLNFCTCPDFKINTLGTCKHSEQDRQRLMIGLNCMRMVSNSTYILDQKTRHDTKIDELMTLLQEIFENREKVVIFSQWERMTRLVADELNALKVSYQYLHMGVCPVSSVRIC